MTQDLVANNRFDEILTKIDTKFIFDFSHKSNKQSELFEAMLNDNKGFSNETNC